MQHMILNYLNVYARSTAENQIFINVFNLLELVQNGFFMTFYNSLVAAFLYC